MKLYSQLKSGFLERPIHELNTHFPCEYQFRTVDFQLSVC